MNAAAKSPEEEDESSVIKCVCGYQDDDGSTVLCEECNSWQHIECYYPDTDVPEVHECVDCDPRPLDAEAAAERQRLFREERTSSERKSKRSQSKGSKKKSTSARERDLSNASAHASTKHSHGHGQAHERKHSSSPKLEALHPSKRPKTAHRASSTSASSAGLVAADSSGLPLPPPLPPPPPPPPPPGVSSAPASSLASTTNTANASTPSRAFTLDSAGAIGPTGPSSSLGSIPGSGAHSTVSTNPLSTANILAMDTLSQTTSSSSSTINTSAAASTAASSKRRSLTSTTAAAKPLSGTVSSSNNHPPSGDLFSPEFMQLHRHSDFHTVDVNTYTDLGIANSLHNWLIDPVALSQVTNGLTSDAVFATISGFDELELRAPKLQKMVFEDKSILVHGDHPIMQWLVIETAVPENVFIGELKGQIGRKEDYYTNPDNRWDTLRHPQPFVFFPPFLPIYIDSRSEGSMLRYVRRSCKPNLKMQILIDDATYHFCFVSTRPIDAGEELTVTWDIDETARDILSKSVSNGHARKEGIHGADNDYLSDWATGILLNFGGCACSSTHGVCLLERFDRRNSHYRKDTAQTPRPTPAATVTRTKKVKKPSSVAVNDSPSSGGINSISRAGSESGLKNGRADFVDVGSVAATLKSKPLSDALGSIPSASTSAKPSLGVDLSSREMRKLKHSERLFQSALAKRKRVSESLSAAPNGHKLASPTTKPRSKSCSKPTKSSVRMSVSSQKPEFVDAVVQTDPIPPSAVALFPYRPLEKDQRSKLPLQTPRWRLYNFWKNREIRLVSCAEEKSSSLRTSVFRTPEPPLAEKKEDLNKQDGFLGLQTHSPVVERVRSPEKAVDVDVQMSSPSSVPDVLVQPPSGDKVNNTKTKSIKQEDEDRDVEMADAEPEPSTDPSERINKLDEQKVVEDKVSGTSSEQPSPNDKGLSRTVSNENTNNVVAGRGHTPEHPDLEKLKVSEAPSTVSPTTGTIDASGEGKQSPAKEDPKAFETATAPQSDIALPAPALLPPSDAVSAEVPVRGNGQSEPKGEIGFEARGRTQESEQRKSLEKELATNVSAGPHSATPNVITPPTDLPAESLDSAKLADLVPGDPNESPTVPFIAQSPSSRPPATGSLTITVPVTPAGALLGVSSQTSPTGGVVPPSATSATTPAPLKKKKLTLSDYTSRKKRSEAMSAATSGTASVQTPATQEAGSTTITSPIKVVADTPQALPTPAATDPTPTADGGSSRKPEAEGVNGKGTSNEADGSTGSSGAAASVEPLKEEAKPEPVERPDAPSTGPAPPLVLPEPTSTST